MAISRRLIRFETDPGLRLWGWALGALLLLAVAFLGGSARHDHVQIIVLRPVAVICLFAALAFLKTDALREYRAIAVLFALFCLWMLIQLVPLPPAIWQALPGRDVVAAFDSEVTEGVPWRPISLNPAIGWSAFASLAVPGAALVLAIAFRFAGRHLVWLVVGLGLLNIATLFTQQALGGSESNGLYRLSNEAGLFANENHLGAFLALTLMAIMNQLLENISMRGAQFVSALLAFFYLLTLVTILVGGSRAGIVLGLLAVVGTALMGLAWRHDRQRDRMSRSRKNPKRRRYKLAAIGLSIGILILLATFIALDRVPGLENIVNEDTAADLRWDLIEPVSAMIAQYWFIGIGIGGFAAAYPQFEPTAIAGPSYVNQAHNDWAQFILEGGLPAILLLAALVWVITLRTIAIVRTTSSPAPHMLFWGFSALIITLASVVDYPLRTAIFQVTLVWLICALLREEEVDTTLRNSHRAAA